MSMFLLNLYLCRVYLLCNLCRCRLARVQGLQGLEEKGLLGLEGLPQAQPRLTARSHLQQGPHVSASTWSTSFCPLLCSQFEDQSSFRRDLVVETVGMHFWSTCLHLAHKSLYEQVLVMGFQDKLCMGR